MVTTLSSIYLSGIAAPTPTMRLYAKQAVKRCVENEWMIYIGAHPKGIDEAMREFCTASGIAFGICTAEQKIPDSETLEQYMKRSEPAMALTDRSMFIGTSPAVAKCIAMGSYAKSFTRYALIAVKLSS
jgi:hypothetical protein